MHSISSTLPGMTHVATPLRGFLLARRTSRPFAERKATNRDPKGVRCNLHRVWSAWSVADLLRRRCQGRLSLRERTSSAFDIFYVAKDDPRGHPASGRSARAPYVTTFRGAKGDQPRS